jgi:hypothetical protein
MTKRFGYRIVLALCFVLGSCVTRPVPSPEVAGMMPVLSVERFLQAANAKDLGAMRQLFGTHDGPIDGDRKELELRMAAIAEVLHHEDYKIQSDSREPGRQFPTTRVTVSLTKNGKQIADIPFLVVQTSKGGWLVEQVDLERVMRG